MPQPITDMDKKEKTRLWLKRSGVVVFLLFLLKGLVWLGVAAFVWFGLNK